MQPPKRQRMPRDERFRQLLEISWQVIRQEGTDALTLGRLSEKAGVTKPVIYDHFPTRNALLIALYKDFDVRQTALMDTAIKNSGPKLPDRASVIASSYVECVLTQGREMPGVLAALAGSPELSAVKHEYQKIFIKKCQAALAPFVKSKTIPSAGFWAILGAADSLSHAAAVGEITKQQAQNELREIIIATVSRAV